MPVKLKQISGNDVRIGDEIILDPELFGNYDKCLPVIAISTNYYFYVGHSGDDLHKSNFSNWDQFRRNNINWDQFRRPNSGIIVSNDAESYKYFMSLHKSYAYYLGANIFIPDQTCATCNTPAPHMNPNNGNAYICIFCSVLGEITNAH